ncbi:hypothetical protein [Nocardioides alcanivorans]|uniref:hypothetical protein n=1 Tax=Nocardioides alcanivorans TaxID=2897352 RepID=UPI001F20AF9A|nr:hypothetical protein [Nocardioides alcanivorans]
MSTGTAEARVHTMELIGIELTEFTRRSRSVLLKHCDLALDRVLLVGRTRRTLGSRHQRLPLRHRIVDTDVVGDSDLRYRLEVGLRLPEGIALDRVTGMSPIPLRRAVAISWTPTRSSHCSGSSASSTPETRPRGLAHDR